MQNPLEHQKNFVSGLITGLSVKFPDAPPSKAEVEQYAQQYAQLANYSGDLEPVIEEALIAVDTTMGSGTSLIDIEADHNDQWVYERQDIQWRYADAYESYLKKEGWHPNVVQSLSDVSRKILGNLQDPKSEGQWDRRGLVIGHVQSGKTANYLSVIGRAADSGYKFLIVIAGIHNNLRKQTQERIEEGFVGLSSDLETKVPVGVGLDRDYPNPITLTTQRDDFNRKTASQSGWKLNDFSKPIVIVIKKNVHTLDALYRWLKEMNAQGDGKISDVPMLMIDDEADNASINTNKEDIDPTRTNGMIRRILGLFAKSCYVGYTATPFANIFINPEAYDEEAYDELFPRDFIYCLDAPSTYFGPDTVFLDEEHSEEVVEVIEDGEEYLPLAHKKDHDIHDLPPSLYRAIREFIIVCAIRNLRGHEHKHSSMMVNVSRFVSIQREVREFISVYERKLREAVKANYARPDSIAQKNRHMAALRETFEDAFGNCGFNWSEVKSELWNVFENLRLFVVNSKSDETLDYKKYQRGGTGLRAIAVGGLSLSRGLTIEGLCVSYMYRNTKMYDTLMQMGRWFGYRPGYDDLCRVHLSPDSIDWYSHIADAAEELRQQVKQMRRDGLSPRQFGLYVNAHPDRLLVTATNKMRSGEKVKIKQNYSGRLIESYILSTDNDINVANDQLISKYWREAQERGMLEKLDKKGWIIRDIPVTKIEEFLVEFRTHPEIVERKNSLIAFLQALNSAHPFGDILLLSIPGNGEDVENFRLGTQERQSARLDPDIEGAWHLSKDRVASRGDEKLGLSTDQIHEAERIASEDGNSRTGKPSDVHFRRVRNKPLLMLHVLGPVGNSGLDERVPAFGVSFPDGYYQTEIEVVVNRVWLERMRRSEIDNPDEEEDFD